MGTHLGAALLAAIIAVVITLVATGSFMTTILDQAAVQERVATVLRDDFGLVEVSEVACPAEQEAVTGTRFDCTFSYQGTEASVPIEVLNDDGQYRIGNPE